MKKIIIIDDESSIRNFLRVTLEANDFVVVEAATGSEAIEKIKTENASLVILDFGLPDMTGIDVLITLRKLTKIPVLFLTVRDAIEDKVMALDLGADDYLTKPFSVSELLARLRVALRHAPMDDGQPNLRFGPVTVDTHVHKILYENTELKLTATEYELLKLLVKNGERLVPHQTILKEVWGPNSLEHHHYLRVYFGQIRKKLDKLSHGAGSIIENESGVGYRLKHLSASST
jgi:two-component system, OmpR family, KDP operon response regulator KdpE